MVEPVEQVVAKALAAGPHATEVSVFGTADPAQISGLVERFCAVHLGDRPVAARFYLSSVGCVAGLRLAAGRDVVVKVYQPRWRAPFLTAVQEVQRHLVRNGLPCACPVVAPTPLAPGRDTLAVVETWLQDPGMRVISSSAALAVSAAGLARQISLCDGLDIGGELRNHPLRPPASALYGEPHSPLFDFGRSSAGAEWIDELAKRAMDIRDCDATRQVIGHTDWSARNVRLDERRLLAVYDWDSLAVVEESTAVGQAAITWRVTAESGGTEFPSAPEVARFVSAYEAAARRGLSESAWRAAGAAAAYTLAYTARCEHSLEFAGIDRSDPRVARDRLADSGELLLALHRGSVPASSRADVDFRGAEAGSG